MRQTAGMIASLALPFLVLAAVLPLGGCGSQASWSDALDQTAPPDPEQSEITSPRRIVTRQRSTPPPAAATRESSRTGESDRVDSSADTENLDSELLLLLQGDLSSFAGAVRCYVDGEFVGQADENGRMRVPIASGNRYIEIWDSRGRWEAEIVAIAGQTATVTIRSEDRGGEGLY